MSDGSMKYKQGDAWVTLQAGKPGDVIVDGRWVDPAEALRHRIALAERELAELKRQLAEVER